MTPHLIALVGSGWDWDLSSLLFIAHLCGFILAIYALYHEYSPQGALAWVISLILLPIPTIAFYLALGSGRIRRQDRGELPSARISILRKHWMDHQGENHGIPAALAKLTQLPSCVGNQLTPLENGRVTFESLAKVIREAEKFILVEFYIIKDDLIGKKLRDALITKAEEGVMVYVIYDEIGSHKLPLLFIHRLKQAGVQVTPFNGKRFWLSSILRVNYRNHRKLVVVDGQHAWLGGLNVGDEYLMGKGTSGRWRDTFVHMQGPIVSQGIYCFAKDWYRATGEDILEHLNPRLELPMALGDQQAMLLPSTPESLCNAWQTCLLALAGTVNQRLWLAAPYFVPSTALNAALQTASLRGVDVRIIVPQQSDHSLVSLAMLSYLEELESCGVKMMAYMPGFMHQKVLLADDNISLIGSANLDQRSLNLNYELGCLIYDKKMASSVCQMLERDMEQCYLMSHEQIQDQGILKRTAIRLCRLLAPIL